MAPSELKSDSRFVRWFRNIFNYLLISNLFTGAFVYYTGYFDFYLSHVFMAIFLLAWIIFYRRLNIRLNFRYVLLSVLIFSLIYIFQGHNSLTPLLKVMIGFIINGITYYLLIGLNGNKVDRLFNIYMQFACVVALIGLFQEISYWAGFKPGFEFRSFIPRTVFPSWQCGILKVTSIMQEPSHLGAAMAPALFVSILNIIRGKSYFINKQLSWTIIICILLSFSLVSYLGIIIAFVLLMLNYKKVKMMVVCTLILIVFGFTVYTGLPDIRLRVNDTFSVVTGQKPLDYQVNLSVFVILRNGFVAYKSLSANPLFGGGLGSHSLTYSRYVQLETNPAQVIFTINKEDASGLFLRLLSETGLLGAFLFIGFIFRCYISRAKEGYFWIISNAIICLFILNLLRQGNYFYNGFIFFVWLYYFTYKNALAVERPV